MVDNRIDATIPGKDSCMITVLTPTYNRAHSLPRVYASLQKQTFRDFEWIIVDDGSTDETKQLVDVWQQEEHDFPIRYFWQPNQHKKVAFNRGVREARGQWIVHIDSDDELLPDSLANFKQMWESIPEADRNRYVAVVGLCVDEHGKVVGDNFPSSPMDASYAKMIFEYRITGEKFSCMRTDVLQAYPFPEDIPGYVPENVIWLRISKRYIQRYFNIPVRIYHYDVESITRPKNYLQAKKNNVEGALLSYAECLDWVTGKYCMTHPIFVAFLSIQYVRWGFYGTKAQRNKYRPTRVLSRFLVWLATPFGFILYWLDRVNINKRIKVTLDRIGIRFH